MTEIITSFVVSLVAASLLWALLPRGVVLTRSNRISDWRGEPRCDTWVVKNDSPLPVRIVDATVASPHTYDSDTDRIRRVRVESTEAEAMGVTLQLDYEMAENSLQDAGRGWSGVLVEPGDTMTAHVPTNTDLAIRYRRTGIWGMLERRTLTIRGGA